MKICRDFLEETKLFQSLLSLEFLILARILGRSQRPEYCFFFFSILLRIDGVFVRYVRLMEHGDAVGFGAELMRLMGKHSTVTEFIEDYQYTMDTESALMASRESRNQKDDLTACTQAFDTLTRISNEDVDKKTGVMLILHVDALLRCTNMDPNFVIRTKQSLTPTPRSRFNLCTKFWMSCHLPPTLTMKQQLQLVNCIEPKFIHFPYSKSGVTWDTMSTKHAIIHDNLALTLAARSSEKSLAAVNSRARMPQRQRGVRPSALAKPLRFSSIESLKSQFVSAGFFRVVFRDAVRVSVVWNAYDACTGIFALNHFIYHQCLTSTMLHHRQNSGRGLCDHQCPQYLWWGQHLHDM
jgi:hypothetical protein